MPDVMSRTGGQVDILPTVANLLDNSDLPGGSTEAQFTAAQQLLNLSNSYLLQLPDRPDQQ